MKTYKTVALGAALAIALLGLSACGSKGKENSDSSGSKTLKVAVWNYETIPEFKALFKAFEEKNKGVKVEAVDIPADSYEQKLTTMLSGGDKTDVLAMKNLSDYSTFATRNQLQDMTDHVKGLKNNDPAKDVLKMYEIDGKYYGQPYRQDFWVLYYNKTMMKEAGITDVSNLTWDEYVDYAKKLTNKDKGVYGAYMHTWRSLVLPIAAAQNGKDLLNPSYDYFKPYYERMLDLQKSKAIMEFGTAKSTKVTYGSQFGTGKAAMLPMGTWYMPVDGSQKATVEWSIAPMPQKEKGKVTTIGSPTGFAISKHAASSKLAQEFIDFAAGEEGAKVVAEAGVIPAYRTGETDKIYFSKKGMPTDEVAKKAFKPDKIEIEMPLHPKAASMALALQEEHELIMTGSEPIDKGIANMEKRMKELLNK